MTEHDKALEEAAEAMGNLPYTVSLYSKEAAHTCVTAYHAALEGQGESEIAEAFAVLNEARQVVGICNDEAEIPSTIELLSRFDNAVLHLRSRLAELERERDTLKSSVAEMQKFLGGRFDEAAQAERLRALQYAVNSFIEAVKPLVDDAEQSNG